MEIKKEKLNTLEGVLDKIWLMLEKGASHSDDPFHWPVLGTTANQVLQQENPPFLYLYTAISFKS